MELLPARNQFWSVSIKDLIRNLMILGPCLAGAESLGGADSVMCILATAHVGEDTGLLKVTM